MLAKAFGFDELAFASYLGGRHEFYDGPGSFGVPLDGTFRPSSIPARPEDVASVFYHTERQVDALNSQTSPYLLVFFRPSAINTSDPNGGSNLSLIFHEALHGFLKKSDDEIQRALDPAFLGGPSVNISDYIRKN